ncbi:MAG: hypothetical protein ACI9SK_000307 [Zhongshania sp.]|jgi:hypothetical protein
MANLWLGNHSQLPIKLATVKSDQLKSSKGDSFKVCLYRYGRQTTEVKTTVPRSAYAADREELSHQNFLKNCNHAVRNATLNAWTSATGIQPSAAGYRVLHGNDRRSL